MYNVYRFILCIMNKKKLSDFVIKYDCPSIHLYLRQSLFCDTHTVIVFTFYIQFLSKLPAKSSISLLLFLYNVVNLFVELVRDMYKCLVLTFIMIIIMNIISSIT